MRVFASTPDFLPNFKLDGDDSDYNSQRQKVKQKIQRQKLEAGVVGNQLAGDWRGGRTMMPKCFAGEALVNGFAAANYPNLWGYVLNCSRAMPNLNISKTPFPSRNLAVAFVDGSCVSPHPAAVGPNSYMM